MGGLLTPQTLITHFDAQLSMKKVCAKEADLCLLSSLDLYSYCCGFLCHHSPALGCEEVRTGALPVESLG